MSDHRDRPTESFKDRWNATIDAWVPWTLFGFIIVAAVDSARGLADGIDGLVDYLGLLIIMMAAVIAAMFVRIWRIRRRARTGAGDG